jgi:hypothetical protein
VVTLAPEEVERLEAQGWRTQGWRFRKGVVTDGEDQWGQPTKVLRRRKDGSCLLLDDDGLCRIHKRLGHAAKPRVCRQFPYVFINAPTGPRVAATCECTTRHRSVQSGAPLEESREEIESLYSGTTPYRARFRVRVSSPGRLLTNPEYGELEQALADAIAREPLIETLHGVARTIDAFRGRPALKRGVSLAVEDTLTCALPVVRDACEDSGRRALADACGLLQPASRWSEALRVCDGDPAAASFLRSAMLGWLDEAFPARAPTAEDGVGRMLLGAVLVAAPALSDLHQRNLPHAMNAVARVVSLAFRGQRGAQLHEDLGGTAVFVKSFAAGPETQIRR